MPNVSPLNKINPYRGKKNVIRIEPTIAISSAEGLISITETNQLNLAIRRVLQHTMVSIRRLKLGTVNLLDLNIIPNLIFS